MAARRCSLHGINFPTSEMRCPICGDQLDFLTTADPDEDWQLAAEIAAQQQPSTEADRIEQWRLVRCLDLGYDVEMAVSIAVSDADMNVLEYRLIRRGCPLLLAARII